MHIKFSFILLINAISIITTMPLIAADDFYLNNMKSPQISDMFRYGNVETSLFTGKLNLSIPIYQLEDPDFNLNIVLRYNSEGFKPRKHSGYIGYNWFLEAGGCITREVRNIPDEYQRDYGSYKVKGMLPFTVYDKVDKDSIFMLHDDMVRECSMFSFNLDPTCKYDVDYLPDIFHFNFCGYQGTFMINNNGEVVITEGDYVKIDLDEMKDLATVSNESAFPTPNVSSRIKIITTDGYTYIFGGDRSSIEYTLAASDTKNISKQFPTPITTWHLKKIIAPNKRTISFYYKDFETNNPQKSDPLWMFNEYYNYFKETDVFRIEWIRSSDFDTDIDIEEEINKMAQNISKECIIDSIVVSGQNNLHIAFHNSIAPHKLYNHTYYLLCNNNYMLDSICVRTDERILTNARLTSIYKSFLHENTDGLGYYWRFLSSVDIDGVGKYLLEYNHPTRYPDLYDSGSADFNRIDFYGFCKSNVFSGTLKKITYPTGGHQIFTFEKNDCGIERWYHTHDTMNVEMISKIRSNKLISGIRIASIDTYEDNELIERKTYTYKQKGTNKSSGIYYNQAQIYYANDSTRSILTDGNTCYSFLGSHIGYSYVEEKTKNIATGEENKVGHTFSTGISSFNSLTDNTINRIPKERARLVPLVNIQYLLSGMLNYNNELDGIGKLLLIEYYKNNVPTQTIQFEYNGIDNLTTELIPQSPSALGCTDTIVVFSHYFAPIARKLFVYPNVLTQKIVKDYGLDGQFLISSTNYTYDSKFRTKQEWTTNSDGMTYFTKYTYPDEFNFSNMSIVGLYPSPYALLKKRNQISEPIETISGYMDGDQEKVTSGRINVFKTNLAIQPKNSRAGFPGGSALDSMSNPIPDSMILQTQPYPVLYKNLDLHIANSINDYQPISVVNDSLRYDNRYRLTCTYEFDSMLRLTSITPVNNVTTSYTWDGIYPVSKTVGNQTSTFSYIPYVGMSSMTDARGVTTYYSYDTYGRLIEVYRQHNTHGKEILNHYIYHIKLR